LRTGSSILSKGSNMNITICPPMPAHGTPRDEFAFGIRRPHPVEAHSNGNDSYTSTGISWDDFSRGMNIQTRKTVGERRKPTPAWSLNDSQTREVMASYIEGRSGLRFPHAGTPRERIARAMARLAAKEEKKVETLTKLNEEYIVTESPERKKELARVIEVLDSEIHINRNLDAIVAAIIYLYYRGAQDSVGVAFVLDGVKPAAIRQMLFRLNACADGLTGNGQPPKRKTQTCGCEECKTTRATKPAPKPREKEESLCSCGQPAPPRCKYCEKCYIATLTPRHCTVCGTLCPKGRRTLCGSAACKRERQRRYDRAWYKANTAKKKASKKSRTKAQVFCSPVCKDVAKHAPVVVAVMSAFGVTYEQAQRSSTGGESYETYLAFAQRSGVQPMPEERWAILR
jgi:hypothetical protein